MREGPPVLLCRYDDRGMNSCYLREDTWAFALRQWAGGLKFWLAQALLRALGYPAVARKVWAGWLVRMPLAGFLLCHPRCTAQPLQSSGMWMRLHDSCKKCLRGGSGAA